MIGPSISPMPTDDSKYPKKSSYLSAYSLPMILNTDVLEAASPKPCTNLRARESTKKVMSSLTYTRSPNPIEAKMVAKVPIIIKFFLPTF